MRFGDVGANDPIPCRELYFQVSPQAWAPTVGGENWWLLGQFTMPFTGRVQCNAWLRARTNPGVQAFLAHSIHSVYSSPAPSWCLDTVAEDEIGSSFYWIVDIETWAGWNSVTVGTLVTIYSRLYVANAQPFVEYIGGFVRLSR